jgi:hypothetical protein
MGKRRERVLGVVIGRREHGVRAAQNPTASLFFGKKP